jgi:predicted nucleic acid-binding protein
VQLVDTNIVGNLLLDGPQGPAARALYAKDSDWTSEPLLLVELTNVLVTGLRQKRLSTAQAESALARAHEMLDGYLHLTPDRRVLALAARYGISGYDARFICVALEIGSPLVTEDAGLRRKVPDATRSMAEALAAGGSHGTL